MNQDPMRNWGSPQEGKSCLRDLLEVLRAHPAGLRRWSVMRAMRIRRRDAGHEITPKFEDEVERVFRRHCTGDTVRAGLSDATSELFHRPKGKAGEVWAAYPEKASDQQDRRRRMFGEL